MILSLNGYSSQVSHLGALHTKIMFSDVHQTGPAFRKLNLLCILEGEYMNLTSASFASVSTLKTKPGYHCCFLTLIITLMPASGKSFGRPSCFSLVTKIS